MIHYNYIYSLAYDQFYSELETEDTFEEWLQKHTVMDHVARALLIRQPKEEVHEDAVEFHDSFWFINEDGDVGDTDPKFFEELLQQPLSVREGHAEVVRDADRVDINGMVYS